MFKRCTNSACRRQFEASLYADCPHCGKEYPRVVNSELQHRLVLLGAMSDQVDMIKAIKLLRELVWSVNGTVKLGLKEAKEIMYAVPEGSDWVIVLPDKFDLNNSANPNAYATQGVVDAKSALQPGRGKRFFIP